MLVELPLLFEVSLFGVEPIDPELGLLLELEPMLPELPLVLPVLPEDDVPPEALDEPWPAFHSSRLIWPSWFLSSLSNSAELPLLEDELPPAALLGDEDDEDDGVELELELPPVAELDLSVDDEPLLCAMGVDDDLLLFCFAESSA